MHVCVDILLCMHLVTQVVEKNARIEIASPETLIGPSGSADSSTSNKYVDYNLKARKVNLTLLYTL